jgi:shikimate kinase
VLIGMCCAGKTTIGRLLAAQLGATFHDVIDATEQRVGLSISALREQKTEQGVQRELAVDLFSAVDGIVKGQLWGVVEFPAELPMIGRDQVIRLFPRPYGTTIIYLRANSEALLRRIESVQSAATSHPSSAAPASGCSSRHAVMLAPRPRPMLETLLRTCDPFFHSVSHLVIDVSRHTPDESIAQLVQLLPSYNSFINRS